MKEIKRTEDIPESALIELSNNKGEDEEDE